MCTFAMSCGIVRVKLSCLSQTFTAKTTEIWFHEDYFTALITIPIKSTFKVEVGTPNSIKITGLSIKKKMRINENVLQVFPLS